MISSSGREFQRLSMREAAEWKDAASISYDVQGAPSGTLAWSACSWRGNIQHVSILLRWPRGCSPCQRPVSTWEVCADVDVNVGVDVDVLHINNAHPLGVFE